VLSLEDSPVVVALSALFSGTSYAAAASTLVLLPSESSPTSWASVSDEESGAAASDGFPVVVVVLNVIFILPSSSPFLAPYLIGSFSFPTFLNFLFFPFLFLVAVKD
jgi:hypothetical protein